MTPHQDVKPINVLIAALGGEGGGVLSGWLAAAASAEGLPVQSTSIPGVAQRTGATTYYVEIFPTSWSGLGDRGPVLALSPTPGNVDIMVATEFLEAARAVENGWITPDRTKIIASTHRAYSIIERSAMGDGRYDIERIKKGIQERALAATMFDMEQTAREAGVMLSPIVLGAIARVSGLPIRKETYEEVIRSSGVAVDSNLRGFQKGFESAGGSLPSSSPAPERTTVAPTSEVLLAQVEWDIPEPAKSTALHGLQRLLDYQGLRYAQIYVDRLKPFVDLDDATHGWKLSTEVARHLALRMSYEDIIRVADLKTRADRTDRVRIEVNAKPHEPVVTTEFLKPGLEEATALLPRFLGKPLMEFAIRRGWQDKFNVGLYLKTSTILGFTLLWATGRLAFVRPWTWRYAEEQENIERWLDATQKAARIDYGFGLEVCQCARLVKGYGSTFRRGTSNFNRILDQAVWPAIRNAAAPAAAIARLREAALTDPEGQTLDRAFADLQLKLPN
jgi:indolepyruvate ferredoxin oxidoreductase beta subunit